MDEFTLPPAPLVAKLRRPSVRHLPRYIKSARVVVRELAKRKLALSPSFNAHCRAPQPNGVNHPDVEHYFVLMDLIAQLEQELNGGMPLC